MGANFKEAIFFLSVEMKRGRSNLQARPVDSISIILGRHHCKIWAAILELDA
jgi:hypothetical protein